MYQIPSMHSGSQTTLLKLLLVSPFTLLDFSFAFKFCSASNNLFCLYKDSLLQLCCNTKEPPSWIPIQLPPSATYSCPRQHLACILLSYESLGREQRELAGEQEFSSESLQRNHMRARVPECCPCFAGLYRDAIFHGLCWFISQAAANQAIVSFFPALNLLPPHGTDLISSTKTVGMEDV